MSKVITVWGSPGSGKSMFCCILAKALTRDKQKAIIINADISVPMLPVWLPEQMIETGASIGHVLTSVDIDTTLVASKVTVLKSYPFIGLMGYTAGENPLSYPEIRYEMVLRLIESAAKLVDFVICDCSSNTVSYTHLDVYKRQLLQSLCDRHAGPEHGRLHHPAGPERGQALHSYDCVIVDETSR